MSTDMMDCGRTDCRSAAASAPQRAHQKANDLEREAVGCNGVFGAPVAIIRVAESMCRPRWHTITRRTTGVDLYHAPLESRLPQRASICTTPLWNHAAQNGQETQRAVVPHPH